MTKNIMNNVTGTHAAVTNAMNKGAPSTNTAMGSHVAGTNMLNNIIKQHGVTQNAVLHPLLSRNTK